MAPNSLNVANRGVGGVMSTASLFAFRRRLAAEALTSARKPTFVPVRLTAEPEPYPTGFTGAGECVEIELPGGAVVRLTVPFERLLGGAIGATLREMARETLVEHATRCSPICPSAPSTAAPFP